MRKIEAHIKPFALEDVRDALGELPVAGLTVTEVKGVARAPGHTESYRGARYAVDLLPELKLEVVVPDRQAGEVAAAIGEAARGGLPVDGGIAISELVDVIRIRTGDRGEKAL